MNFENNFSANNSKQENVKGIYPERAFLRVDSEISRLKMIESGEIKKIELTEEERKEVLHFENLLGEKLEKINNIKVNTSNFYPEYFTTNEGRAEFLNTVGIEIVGESIEEVSLFILKNRSLLNTIEGKKLSKLVGKSRAFSDKKIIDDISKKTDEKGDITIEGLDNPVRTNIILNPADALEKIEKLRQFKKEISLSKKDQPEEIDNVHIVKEKIRDMYRKKINVMIVGQVQNGVSVSELAKLLGEDELTEEEKKLKKTVPGLLEFEKVFSRYDRFIYGAAKEYDEKGMRKQIGLELVEYANEIEDKFLADDFNRESKIREKGLDSGRLAERNITVEEFSKWAEELFELYGEKSSLPQEEYDPKRKGSAPDGKWQFIAREETKSMSTNSSQKVIKSGIENKNITETLGTLLGHEFTHFLQALNQSKIPLRLFSEKIGGFRAGVFAEGGAMEIESVVSKELFGYENNPHPHYIRAMVRKLEGGTYLDCVKAFYDSGIKNIKRKKETNKIEEDVFKKEAEKVLKLAVDRTKRLFRSSDRLDSNSSNLTVSSDTMYAEQSIVMKKLKENGLENCAFVKGINLETLATLAEIGLIDLREIKKPNLDLIRKIWEQEKFKYEV